MNTFQFAWANSATLVFRNVETGDLYEIAFPPHNKTTGHRESCHISFPGYTGREGTIYYTQLGRSDANEGQMRQWLSQLTRLSTSEIQLEPYQLP